MNSRIQGFIFLLASIFILALLPADQARAQAGECYTGIVLERNVSLTSTGVKASWTVPAGRLGVSVSRSFQAEIRTNQNIGIDVEVVRNSNVYHVERFGSSTTLGFLAGFTADTPIFLEEGDTIRLNMINAGRGQGTFTLSVSNCPNPFFP